MIVPLKLTPVPATDTPVIGPSAKPVPAIVAAVIPPDPSTPVIVIVASLAVVAPFSCVPTIVIVSLAVKPEPAAVIATVYVVPVLVTLNDPLGFYWPSLCIFLVMHRMVEGQENY